MWPTVCGIQSDPSGKVPARERVNKCRNQIAGAHILLLNMSFMLKYFLI